MDAIKEARERAAKERSERLYAEVRAFSPELYAHAVMVGSMVAQKTGSVEFAAKIEAACMGLINEALTYALIDAVSCPAEGRES